MDGSLGISLQVTLPSGELVLTRTMVIDMFNKPLPASKMLKTSRGMRELIMEQMVCSTRAYLFPEDFEKEEDNG